MKHSLIAPSSAGVWGKVGGCTGSVGMIKSLPEPEKSIHAKEGNASHEIAASMISHPEKIYKSDDWIGLAAVNKIIFTDEMFESAKLYADHVIKEMHVRNIFSSPYLGVEASIKAKKIHHLSYGTCDAYIYDREKEELIIYDYKFGFGIVEAFETWQGINYACGILEMLRDHCAIDEKSLIVRIRIAQPRAYHRDGIIRELAIKAIELLKYFDILHNNAREALG